MSKIKDDLMNRIKRRVAEKKETIRVTDRNKTIRKYIIEFLDERSVAKGMPDDEKYSAYFRCDSMLKSRITAKDPECKIHIDYMDNDDFQDVLRVVVEWSLDYRSRNPGINDTECYDMTDVFMDLLEDE